MFLRRADIPEPIRFSGLRIVVNGWCTTRRFHQETGGCLLVCAAEGEDSLEQNGAATPRCAQRARVSPRALLVDAVLMAHNQARHGRAGTGKEACAARLEERVRRFRSVELVLRRCGAERTSAELEPDR